MLKVRGLLKRRRPPAEPRAVPPGPPSLARVALAWSVHLFTALGLVAAAAMAVLIVHGDGASIRVAFLLMVAATLVDAVDGTFARAVRVKEVLPGFDGRRLDDLTDFLNYTFLPLLLVWRTGLLPAGSDVLLLIPLLASAYGFCQTDVKTSDGYFLGFPSYWNVVAFYLYALPFPPAAALAIVIALAVLTFVPLRYLYPSQPGWLNFWTNLFGAVWAGLLLAAMWLLPNEQPATVGPLTAASLVFPAYYMLVSWYVSWRAWRHVGPT